ncbi:MAG: hypothetical protein ACI8Q9_001928 [Planctomycetota bacterium]
MLNTGTAVAEQVLRKVLAPYKPGCKYLKSAVCELPEEGADHLVRLIGELAIDESCYIQDTGHFNAVEFNISYNQLIYALLGHCIVEGILPAFRGMGFSEYLARQLPDVLIHKFESKFRRPMSPLSFRGYVDITETVDRGPFIIVKTFVRFEDEAGGNSHGEVTLAILKRPIESA